MERRWKWIATAMGLALTAFTGYVALTDYQRNQPRLEVSRSGAVLLEKPINKRALLADLSRIERDHTAYTSMHIVNLLRWLEDEQLNVGGEETNGSQGPLDTNTENLIERVNNALVDITSPMQAREAAIRDLAGALALLAQGLDVDTFEPKQLVESLRELEDSYVAYSQNYVVSLMAHVDADGLDPTAARDLVNVTVSQVREMAAALSSARSNIDSSLRAVLNELSGDGSVRLHVWSTLENHSQLPTVVRNEGAIAVLGDRGDFLRMLSVEADSDQEIEGFSIRNIEFRSQPLPPQDKEMPALTTAKCIMSVQDIHGRHWRSEVTDCVNPRGNDETTNSVNWLRTVASDEFGQLTTPVDGASEK